MNAHLLAELAHLFSVEALETDRRGDEREADRLWGLAEVLHDRFVDADRRALGVDL